MRGFKLLQTRLLSAFLVVLSAFGQAYAEELAVLNDRTARVVNLGSQFGCYPNGSVRLEASSAGFFDKRRPDLGNLYGAALNQLLSRCPALKQIILYGLVDDIEIVRATAKASDSWVLRLEPTKIDKVAASILTDITSYRDLPKLEGMFRPFRQIKGIIETNGYLAFASNAKSVVNRLNSDSGNFERFAEQLAKGADPKKSERFVEEVLVAVSYYDPVKADVFRSRYIQIANRSADSELEILVSTMLIPQENIANAVNNISSRLNKKPPSATQLTALDLQISNWIEQRLSEHEATFGGPSLSDQKAHFELVRSFEGIVISPLIPTTESTLETASFWFEAVAEENLAETFFDAKSIIDTTGEGYADVDLVLETGMVLSEEFSSYSFPDEASGILDYTFARIDNLIQTGLSEYRDRLVSEPMSLESAAVFRDEAATFFELSQDFPGFTAYVDTIEAGIRDGKLEACRNHAGRLSNAANRGKKLDISGNQLTLKQLTCRLYENDHLLTDLSVSADQNTGVLSIQSDGGGEVTFELTAGVTNSVLFGVSATWDEEMLAMIQQEPSGEPDASGVTECDVLAGDPFDTSQPTAGVDLETVASDFDFDRAIDACIAAVEHDPMATRQMYQLARILDFLGDADNSAQYIEAAAASGFGPAIHLKAVSALTYRDDDAAYFDAIDWFKEAAARGYAPAKTELATLIPAGTEIFREIPPPTSQEVLNAFGPDICADEGLLVTCVFFEEVRKNECFQTSGNEFSCEVVMKYSCDVRGKGGDPVGNFFANGLGGGGGLNRACKQNPETDPLFVKFVKTENGRWSYEREF